MRRNIIVFVLMMITPLFLVAGCGDDNAAVAVSRSLGTMNGHVISIIDDSGIVNAEVEIWSVPIDTFPADDKVGGEVKITAITNDQGYFNVPVQVGKIMIRANADGFMKSPPQLWTLSRDTVGTLNFTLYLGEGELPFDPPSGIDIFEEWDDMEAFDPCNPGFEREGPHDDKKCGEE
ncbi:MAG: carboxypeptidase-like regulatory domain-containing protein [bacterium]